MKKLPECQLKDKMKILSPDLMIHSRRVVFLASLREATILIKDGIIADVVDGTQKISDCPFEDFGDLVVMPGIVDTHVHLNDPGRTGGKVLKREPKQPRPAALQRLSICH